MLKKYKIYYKISGKGKASAHVSSQRGDSASDAISRWKLSNPQKYKKAYSIRASLQ